MAANTVFETVDHVAADTVDVFWGNHEERISAKLRASRKEAL